MYIAAVDSPGNILQGQPVYDFLDVSIPEIPVVDSRLFMIGVPDAQLVKMRHKLQIFLMESVLLTNAEVQRGQLLSRLRCLSVGSSFRLRMAV